LDYIDIHTHHKTATGKTILNLFPTDHLPENSNSVFSIGLHPWHIEASDVLDKIEIVRSLAKLDSCIAIGETGIDKLAETNYDLQTTVFENHVEIAVEMGKPLIIHCVRAFDDLIRIKKNAGSVVPWIVHGFNSNLSIAERLLNEGFTLSFGKALAQNGSNAQKIIGLLMDNDFFLETDDGTFSIKEIYLLAAKIRKTTIENLMTLIQRNFEKTFILPHE
jgi:TatD DNase family protein